MTNLDPIPEAEIAQLLSKHAAGWAVLLRYAWGNGVFGALRKAGYQEAMSRSLEKGCADTDDARFNRFLSMVECGRFVEADAIGERLLIDKRFIGRAAIQTLIYQTMLRAMLHGQAIDAAIVSKTLAKSGIEDSSKLALAYIDGGIDDNRFDALVVKSTDGDMLYYARGLRRLAMGDHAGAKSDLERVVKHEDWTEAGSVRGLLAWYAKQTPATLGALPKAATWPNNGQGLPKKGANNF